MTSNDEALIRHAAFLKIIKIRHIGPSDLERLSEQTPGVTRKTASYWSDLKAGRKSFGEKVARDIETMLQLPRGELDTLIGTPTMTMAQLNGFEGQLVTLFRQMTMEEQDAMLMALNNRLNERAGIATPTAANPYPKPRRVKSK